VIRDGEKLWVYRTDEVAGVFHLTKDQITAAPATVVRKPDSLVKGIFSWDEHKVALLNSSLLINVLEKVVA
jgi:chemotaxis signal transduction protein